MISDAEETIINALYEYGDALGVAFQIVDDLLDVAGDSKIIGKNNGDDFRERKLTLPYIKAISSCNQNENDFWKRTIEKGDQTSEDFNTALKLMQKYEAIERTRIDALKWAKTAKNSLDAVPENDIKIILTNLAEYVVDRVK